MGEGTLDQDGLDFKSFAKLLKTHKKILIPRVISMDQDLQKRRGGGVFVRLLVCGIFLSLLWAPEKLSAGCERILKLMSQTENFFKKEESNSVPIGIAQKDFDEFVQFLNEDPIFSEAEAIIVYGSRTNHREGPAPTSVSDLDLRVLWKTKDSSEEFNLLKQLQRVVVVNEALSPWSQRFGFNVSIEIPSFVSFKEFVFEQKPMNAAIEELKQLDRRLLRDEFYDRTLHKMKASEILNRHELSINPGAVFIVRSSDHVDFLVKRLKDLGVRNIIQLN
jgi:hypothetical protein